MVYEDRHRLFLQFMLSTPAVSEEEALSVYSKVVKKFVEDGPEPELEDLKTLVCEINHEISSLNMQLRLQICEVTCVRYITLINTASSPINATLTNYTTQELEYFKKVIDEIVGTDDGQVSHITCLNIEDIKPLRKADFEKLLVRFVEEKWLAVYDVGKYRLGIRSLSELRPYLTNVYKDFLMKCALCSEMIFYGRRCQHCGSIAHVHCLLEYVRAKRGNGNIKCPGTNCDHQLDNMNLLIEATAVENESPTGPSGRKKLRTVRY